MLRLVYTLIICFGIFSSAWADGSRYAEKSVLSEGRWVKIQVDSTGVYKLTSANLRQMGFSDISKVAVYGYGGWPLDEDFSKNTYIDDLPEVATWRGNGDFILFFAKGPIKWEYVSASDSFVHTNNPYSTAGYYFVTEKDNPKQMETAPSVANGSLLITTFDDYALWERDLVSVNESGRELYGESFATNLSQNFYFNIPGITNEPGKTTFRFIASSTSGGTTASMTINGESQSTLSFPSNRDSYTSAIERNTTQTWHGDKTERVVANIRYSRTGDRNVHLDYIRLQMRRELRPYGSVTFFRNIQSASNASRFVINNASAGMFVLDVTNGVNPQLIETSLNGSELSFFARPGVLREYAMVQPSSSIPSPKIVGEVKQMKDLHALPQVDMIIIVPPIMIAQAERLAEEHRVRDGLSIEVVVPEDIYNEFSSGTPDATAYRRFMKMFYDRSTSEEDAPKYLLLFGDGAHDNRLLSEKWRNTVDPKTLLLTYQSVNSLRAPLQNNSTDFGTYVTDDYFGLLDDNEGANIATANIDLGIGRFPVRTPEQAQTVVSKIISYMNNEDTGAWKNMLLFMADDGSSSDKYTIDHTAQADSLARYMDNNHPQFLTRKLYYYAHRKDFSSGRGAYPTVREALFQQLREGALLFNYTGHGSTSALSDEQVVTHADIRNFSYNRLPIWITATCDFTRFDAPTNSAGEDVFLNSRSGGIALFTTMRVAYSNPNFEINKALLEYLFEKKDGKYPTLGDAIKNMKRSQKLTKYTVNFMLVGNPAMRLTYPTHEMKVTEINGKPVNEGDNILFKASEVISVKGEVLTPGGQKATTFNGEVNPTIMDSKRINSMFDNNNTGMQNDTFKRVPFAFTDYPIMSKETGTVVNGDFEFTFRVPIDISYSGDFGKMNLYAVDKENRIEAHGNFQGYRVGGTADNMNDKEGPKIRAIYLNDSTFADGGQVNTTPLLVVNVWDESGINITGNSIGHDITLTINNNPSLTYNLNSHYRTIPGSGGEGTVRFLIPTLLPGIHTAEFKVWDIMNNSSTETITFEVVEELKPSVAELKASPSPARENVTFYLYHNRPEANINVTMMVYDMQGRLVWEQTEKTVSNYQEPYTTIWNLTNGSGVRLSSGVYVYRAAISTDNSKEATKANKLIILTAQ